MQIVSTSTLRPPPLRAIRAARGLSLRAVARRSGLDPGHLSKVERGEKHLSIDALYRVAIALELQELAASLEPYLTVSEGA